MRLFIYENTVINVDNDEDAATILEDENCVRELTSEEVTTIFGDYAKYASVENTTVENGTVVFDVTKLPSTVTELEDWLALFVRSDRNTLLTATDFLYRSDIESKLTEAEKISRDVYSQELRDFPATFTEIVDVGTIIWPTKPVFENVTF